MNENPVEEAHAKQKNKVSNLWVGTQSLKEPLGYSLKYIFFSSLRIALFTILFPDKTFRLYCIILVP